MKKYLVKIENFEGPLDLLLHLIREKNLDILTIDVGDITNQYLEYLEQMELLNLDIASDYLVMASYLLEIKSRILLKQNIEEEEAEESDNREELISRLLEYQNIKKTTIFFNAQEAYRQSLATRPNSSFQFYKNDFGERNISWEFNLEQLSHQLQQVYQRYEMNRPMTTRITKQQISPQIRAGEIFNLLKTQPERKFLLFEIFYGQNINLHFIVVSFSAILDLVRNQQISISQKTFFDPITLKYKGEINESI